MTRVRPLPGTSEPWRAVLSLVWITVRSVTAGVGEPRSVNQPVTMSYVAMSVWRDQTMTPRELPSGARSNAMSGL